MKNNFFFKIYGFLFLVLSIVLTVLFMNVRYRESEQTMIIKTIYDITKGYRINQVLASMGMYLVGFAVAYPLCANIGDFLPYLSAMLVGNALWGTVSSVILFLNIPYSKSFTVAFIAVIILFLFRKYKDVYKDIDKIKLLNLLMIVLAFIIMAASGIFPENYSYDSFYYVMQYGELIAKNGCLSSDIVGTYMTWVGITPALISAYAVMFGFETIYAIHHLLIFSMYGFIAFCIYKKAIRFYSKKLTSIFTFLTLITVLFTPIVTALAMWIISNAYFMVYLVFFIMLPVIAKENMDMRVICLMSLYAMWMTLCRIEAAPFMCFLIICITCLDIPKKSSSIIWGAVLAIEALYLFKVFTECFWGEKQIPGLMTLNTAFIILLVFILTGIYFLLYDFKFVVYIRKHMSVIGIIVLIIGCLTLGIFDWERFANNISVTVTNIMQNWFWPLPAAILGCEILKTCFKCRNKYFDLVIWGSVVFYFAICMGRSQYLRLGGGDSYHRICVSVVPLYIMSTIYTFIGYFGDEKACKVEGVCKNEINNSDSLL